MSHYWQAARTVSRSLRRQWMAVAIVGVRLSFSTDARALIAAQRSKQSARIARLPSRPSSENRAALNSAQLASRSSVPELARQDDQDQTQESSHYPSRAPLECPKRR
jgi:hypothetical protein